MKEKKSFLEFLKWKRTRDDVDAVEEVGPMNIKRFFVLLKRKFSQILTLNLLMLFQIIPLGVAFLVYFWGPTAPTQSTLNFPVLNGIHIIDAAPAEHIKYVLSSIQFNLPVYTPGILVTLILLGLFLLVTFGWQNAGCSYVLRGLVNAEPVFIFADFFYAIKRNLKQSFLMGVIDLAAISVLVIDFIFFVNTGGTFWIDFMYFAILAICILYFFMRFYIYLMLVTFNLSIKKILKNALIFSILGFKRNLLAFLGIALMGLLNYLLFIWLLPLGVAIPLILPLVYFLGTASFMSAYAAYPNIKKYMIDPYQTSSDEEITDEE